MCYYVYMGNSAIIFEKLNSLIECPKSELEYSNNFELLVAVMLSAQCTDKRVNMITKDLFKKYATPLDFAKLSVEELAAEIKSCNYYHNKACHIVEASKMLVEKFGGVVPSSHEDLVSLPGVGNKTARVVRVVAFGEQVMPVDTHILRVSNRLGLVSTNSPDVCSCELSKIFKNYDLGVVHHLLLLFGRYYCTARTPKCNGCILRDICKDINKKV